MVVGWFLCGCLLIYHVGCIWSNIWLEGAAHGKLQNPTRCPKTRECWARLLHPYFQSCSDSGVVSFSCLKFSASDQVFLLAPQSLTCSLAICSLQCSLMSITTCVSLSFIWGMKVNDDLCPINWYLPIIFIIL